MPGMNSTVFDLVGKRYSIEKGQPWNFRFSRFAGPGKTPIDLTGCAARLEIFDAFAGGSAEPIVVASSGTGEITIGAISGVTSIDLAAAVTGSINATNGRYKIYFTDSHGNDRLFLRGRLGFIENGE